MIIYQRSVRPGLLLIRCASIVLMIVIVILFAHKMNDYAWVLVILAILAVVVRVTGLKVYSDRLEIPAYYFFGWVCCPFIAAKGEIITISLFELELTNPVTDDMESDVFLSKTVALDLYIIENSSNMGIKKQIKMNLTVNEYWLLKSNFT
jgi:hypothetical protein